MNNNDYFLFDADENSKKSENTKNNKKSFSFKSISRKEAVLIISATVLLICIVTAAVILAVREYNKSKNNSSLSAITSSKDFSLSESKDEFSDLEVNSNSEAEASSANSEIRNEAVSSILSTVDEEKAQVKPSTGNVFTAPEYQYNQKEDVKVSDKNPADIDTDDNNAKIDEIKTDNTQNSNSNSSSESSGVTNSSDKIVRVTATKVNIRDNPSASNTKVLGQSNTNDEFDYLGETNDSNGTKWYKISYNNQVGWIISTYSQVITKNKDDTSSASSDSQSSGSETSPDNSSSTTSSDTASSNTSSGSSASDNSSQNSSSEGNSYTGWTTVDDKTYYYFDNQPVKGWKDINGLRYYFDEETGEKKSFAGIDVSSHQGDIDWKKVKESGVEFAFIRVGYRGYLTGKISADPKFIKNITEAQANGIKCGVYFYSVALNTTEAAEEANFVLEAVKNYKLDLPIVIDYEHRTDRVSSLNNEERTNNILAFLATVQSAGYKGCLYTGHWFYQNLLEYNRLSAVELWIAYYTDNPDRVSDVTYKYWQYSSSGSVPGISGNVDMDVFLK